MEIYNVTEVMKNPAKMFVFLFILFLGSYCIPYIRVSKRVTSVKTLRFQRSAEVSKYCGVAEVNAAIWLVTLTN